MLEINLLPGGARKKASAAGPSIDFNKMFEGLKGQLGNIWTIGPIALLVIALGVGGYLFWKGGHDRTVADERLKKAQDDSARFSNVVAQRNAALAKRDTLLRQVNLIRAIDDDRYIWPHIMDEVSKALPQYTWITQLQYAGSPQGSVNVVQTPKPPVKKPAPNDTAKKKAPVYEKPLVIETAPPRDQVVFRVTGRTVDIQALTRFSRDLEGSPFFGTVFLERTTPSLEGANPFYLFQLTINYSRPDSLAVRRLPLVSTGR